MSKSQPTKPDSLQAFAIKAAKKAASKKQTAHRTLSEHVGKPKSTAQKPSNAKVENSDDNDLWDNLPI